MSKYIWSLIWSLILQIIAQVWAKVTKRTSENLMKSVMNPFEILISRQHCKPYKYRAVHVVSNLSQD